MKELVFATHNPGKLKELQAMIGDRFKLLSLDDLGCHEEIPETAVSFRGNALLKAKYVQEKYGLPCFADDSGLEVSALNDAPGVYTARYAGVGCTSDDNMDKLLGALQNQDDRSARFVCVIALLLKNEPHFFEGTCPGEILRARQGTDGFGYDPIFKPQGYDRSFAQMTMAEKSAISHRGKAVAQLVAFLKNAQ